MFDPITIGMFGLHGVGFVVDGIQAKVLHDHTKEIKELQDSKNLAAIAYNSSQEAIAKANKVETNNVWIQTELTKKGTLPAPPKSNEEIQTEFYKTLTAAMASSMQAASNAKSSGQIDESALSKLISESVAASIGEALKKQGK